MFSLDDHLTILYWPKEFKNCTVMYCKDLAIINILALTINGCDADSNVKCVFLSQESNDWSLNLTNLDANFGGKLNHIWGRQPGDEHRTQAKPTLTENNLSWNHVLLFIDIDYPIVTPACLTFYHHNSQSLLHECLMFIAFSRPQLAKFIKNNNTGCFDKLYFWVPESLILIDCWHIVRILNNIIDIYLFNVYYNVKTRTCACKRHNTKI